MEREVDIDIFFSCSNHSLTRLLVATARQGGVVLARSYQRCKGDSGRAVSRPRWNQGLFLERHVRRDAKVHGTGSVPSNKRLPPYIRSHEYLKSGKVPFASSRAGPSFSDDTDGFLVAESYRIASTQRCRLVKRRGIPRRGNGTRDYGGGIRRSIVIRGRKFEGAENSEPIDRTRIRARTLPDPDQSRLVAVRTTIEPNDPETNVIPDEHRTPRRYNLIP